ncbi:MAG: DUF1874 domain-containing protein [Desulfurococcaceae archaeon]|uniref:DUF1874 domain-containing protein n=1 Tax=Staphylothermus marinus TaxID=2280 RepID=A0A7C4D8J2_STAMA
MKYIVNALSLNMVKLPPIGVRKFYHFEIKQITVEEFCNEAREAVNALGHVSTVELINKLCNTSFQINRIEIKLEHEDELLLIQVATRLPEGKVLDIGELEQLLRDGKIKFYRVTYYDYFY